MNAEQIEALVADCGGACELWQTAVAARPLEIPFFDQLAPFDAFDWGEPLRRGFARNASERELEASRALYFGVYETTDRYELSAKVLYLAGLDSDALGFTSRNIVWKPRWGRLRPRILQAIARIEEGIDPSRRIVPPLLTTATLGQSAFPVADYDATNPGLFAVELDSEQTQYLNYELTLVAALTVVLDFLPSLRYEKPVYTGFDEGDILRLR